MKLKYELAPTEFDDVVLVLQQAAESGKYEPNGWLEGKKFDRDSNIASIKRHVLEYRKGIMQDSESGLHPLLHVACRALMQYTLDQRNTKETLSHDLDYSSNLLSCPKGTIGVQYCSNPKNINYSVYPGLSEDEIKNALDPYRYGKL